MTAAQHGWLSSRPIYDEGEGKKKTSPYTRAEMLRSEDKDLPVSQEESEHYMMDALQRLGPFRELPMGGERATDWPEIAAFAQVTDMVSEPWEMGLLFDMSAAYLGGLRRGRDPLSKCPE